MKVKDPFPASTPTLQVCHPCCAVASLTYPGRPGVEESGTVGLQKTSDENAHPKLIFQTIYLSRKCWPDKGDQESQLSHAVQPCVLIEQA
jgi:hypothetical protein